MIKTEFNLVSSFEFNVFDDSKINTQAYYIDANSINSRLRNIGLKKMTLLFFNPNSREFNDSIFINEGCLLNIVYDFENIRNIDVIPNDADYIVYDSTNRGKAPILVGYAYIIKKTQG